MRWYVQELRAENDEALVERAKRGEKEATEELLNRYKPTVRARARGFFLAYGETEDLVQEGMIGLYLAIGDYNPAMGKSFKNFAYLLVTRRIVDAVRRSARLQGGTTLVSLGDFDFADTELTPEERVVDKESAGEFRVKLMKVLSDFEFRVLSMYLEGMSYANICEATKKGVKSVDNALARAKKKLQRAYGTGGKEGRGCI